MIDQPVIPPSPPQTPTSWRDVYQLVQDAEQRLTLQLTAGFTRQSGVSADHEVRIRVLEASEHKDAAANKTAATAIGVGRSVLVILLSVGSLVVALASLITK